MSITSRKLLARARKSQPWWYPFAFFAFSVSCVITLHAVQAWYGADPLATPWLNGPYVSVDSWSLIHVVTFAYVGFTYPSQLAVFMTYGTVWEFVEYALHFFLRGSSSFWYECMLNSIWDVYFNLVGYRLGEWLLSRSLSKTSKKQEDQL